MFHLIYSSVLIIIHIEVPQMIWYETICVYVITVSTGSIVRGSSPRATAFCLILFPSQYYNNSFPHDIFMAPMYSICNPSVLSECYLIPPNLLILQTWRGGGESAKRTGRGGEEAVGGRGETAAGTRDQQAEVAGVSLQLWRVPHLLPTLFILINRCLNDLMHIHKSSLICIKQGFACELWDLVM